PGSAQAHCRCSTRPSQPASYAGAHGAVHDRGSLDSFAADCGRPGRATSSWGLTRTLLPASGLLVQTLPVLHLPIGFIAADAVGFLNLSDELITTPIDGGELIVGQFAPLLFHFSAELLPVACHAIPVHLTTPCKLTIIQSSR